MMGQISKIEAIFHSTEKKKSRRVTPNWCRAEFLSLLPQNSVCAEIGVDRGTHAKQILNTVSPSHLVLVDIKKNHDFFDEVGNLSHVDYIISKSVDAGKMFSDETFDFVYIDADHYYSSILNDLHVWVPKVKKGGFVCGHDFRLVLRDYGSGQKVFRDYMRRGRVDGDILSLIYQIKNKKEKLFGVKGKKSRDIELFPSYFRNGIIEAVIDYIEESELNVELYAYCDNSYINMLVPYKTWTSDYEFCFRKP